MISMKKKNLISKIKIEELKNLIRYTEQLTKIFIYDSKERKAFIKRLQEIKYEEILIGDCILSDFFTSEKTNLYPERNWELYLYFLLRIVKIRRIKRNLSKILKENQCSYFINHETTGIDEVKRRFLIKEEIAEIRYSPFHRGYRIFKGFKGYELRKAERIRGEIYEKIRCSELKEGFKVLRALTKRNLTYQYMMDEDVSKENELILQEKKYGYSISLHFK